MTDPHRRFFVEVEPLRQSPGFRWLNAGQTLAWLGRQLTVVAVPYQVYRITGSACSIAVRVPEEM